MINQATGNGGYDQENPYKFQRVKPQNLMLESHGKIKFQQFGSIDSPKLERNQKRNSMVLSFTHMIDVPNIIKSGQYLMRKNTVETFMHKSQKELDMENEKLKQKIHLKIYPHQPSATQNFQTQNQSEQLASQAKREGSNFVGASHGRIMCNELWSDTYYNYIVKKSKLRQLKDEMNNLIQTRSLQDKMKVLDQYFKSWGRENKDRYINFDMPELTKMSVNLETEKMQKEAETQQQQKEIDNLIHKAIEIQNHKDNNQHLFTQISMNSQLNTQQSLKLDLDKVSSPLSLKSARTPQTSNRSYKKPDYKLYSPQTRVSSPDTGDQFFNNRLSNKQKKDIMEIKSIRGYFDYLLIDCEEFSQNSQPLHKYLILINFQIVYSQLHREIAGSIDIAEKQQQIIQRQKQKELIQQKILDNMSMKDTNENGIQIRPKRRPVDN